MWGMVGCVQLSLEAGQAKWPGEGTIPPMLSTHLLSSYPAQLPSAPLEK